MTETRPEAPPETPKKGMERPGTIMIVLGILVAALAISNVWTYTSLQGQINTLTAEKNDLISYKATHSYNNTEYDELKSILNLSKSQVLINQQTVSQPAGSYTYWTFSTQYAGYMTVSVATSTTSNTYVQVIYNAYGAAFDQMIPVGVSGTAVFPVLPSDNIQVRVGNTNPINGATQTLTITYHY